MKLNNPFFNRPKPVVEADADSIHGFSDKLSRLGKVARASQHFNSQLRPVEPQYPKSLVTPLMSNERFSEMIITKSEAVVIIDATAKFAERRQLSSNPNTSTLQN